MSSAQSLEPGSQPTAPAPPGRSAGLTLNLSSNNPFRNRAASPTSAGNSAGPSNNNKPTSPSSPFDDPPPRPVSRNPFLDPAYSSSTPSLSLKGPDRSNTTMASRTDTKTSPTAEEIFGSLTLEDSKPPPRPEGRPPPMNRPPGPPGARGENVPPRRGPPPPHHRPSRSQEEAMRARRMQQGGPRPGPSDSPQRKTERRPRRNSDSSVMDTDKPLTEEEKKAREERRKERERRHREMKDKSKPTNRKLDIIDQLDATSIFGTGLFHHDGPFDALNPHRNRKGSRRAPMQAFPKDSLNNSIGGSGPVNKRPDHATFMGHNDDEAFKDYSRGNADGVNKNGYNYPSQARGEMPVFDPMSRGSILHGDETLGLGTSTFLEGTPAARTAIQRREKEQQQETIAEGLQRKKSLAQRIRNINKNPGGNPPHPSGRLTNPEGVYASRRSPDGALPPATTAVAGESYSGEKNPFFNEFTREPESISVRRADTGGPASPTSPMSPPPPRRGSANAGLERRATADGSSPTDAEPGGSVGRATGGGLLARVKSLKGGRKGRLSDAANNPPPPPGTAV